MNSLRKTGIVLATTLASYGLSYGMLSNARYSASELNPQIERCASQLGNTTLKSTLMPEECKDLPYKPKGWFSYNEAETDQYDIETGETKRVSVKHYTMPSKQKFMQENIITPEEESKNSRNTHISAGIVSGLGFIGFTGLFITESRLRKRRR